MLVGVVYLCRFAEGEIPVRRFVRSYRDYPAGIEHDVHVIFKGFPDQNSLASGQGLFEDLPINPIVLNDTGHDIGSYFAAAKAVSNRRLIFLNTFSRILAADWLSSFHCALNLPDVGVVGATGSLEAIPSDLEGAILRASRKIGDLPAYIRKHAAGGKAVAGQNEAWQGPKRSLSRYLLSPFRYLCYLYGYGRYPNPHIRTNAFMIERERFLSLRISPFASKNALSKFESGRRSMTRQITALGLRPVVMDRSGKVYDVPDWKSSMTFRSGAQMNLIVADNRTDHYAAAPAELRRVLEDLAWVHPWSWDR